MSPCLYLISFIRWDGEASMAASQQRFVVAAAMILQLLHCLLQLDILPCNFYASNQMPNQSSLQQKTFMLHELSLVHEYNLVLYMNIYILVGAWLVCGYKKILFSRTKESFVHLIYTIQCTYQTFLNEGVDQNIYTSYLEYTRSTGTHIYICIYTWGYLGI